MVMGFLEQTSLESAFHSVVASKAKEAVRRIHVLPFWCRLGSLVRRKLRVRICLAPLFLPVTGLHTKVGVGTPCCLLSPYDAYS